MTLLEVMVALAITAIALLAASQAMGSITKAAERQTQVILSQICAENALTAARLGNQYPPVGQTSSPCEQMGQSFTVTLFVSATANPSFRRVQAQVSQGSESVLSVSTVIGRY